jgi:hypothetical protein
MAVLGYFPLGQLGRRLVFEAMSLKTPDATSGAEIAARNLTNMMYARPDY